MRYLAFVFILCGSSIAMAQNCANGVCSYVPLRPVRQTIRTVASPVIQVVRTRPTRRLVVPAAYVSVQNSNCSCENCSCTAQTSSTPISQPIVVERAVYTTAPVYAVRRGSGWRLVGTRPVRSFFARRPLRTFLGRLFGRL